jgi:hypothetical protein
MQTFFELTPEDKTKRLQWFAAVREHFAKEHANWAELLIKNLILADTGGIVVVVSLVANKPDLLKLLTVRLSLTAFVFGVVAAIAALFHEFRDVRERLDSWDANCAKHRAGELTFDDLRKADAELGALDWKDRFIAYLPGASFLIGCASSIVLIWSF